MLDVLVVGGGPAGAATAIHAALAGLSVRVWEPRPIPIDKACGEGLMPCGVRMLADELGVRPADSIAGEPFRGIRYTDGTSAATALFASEPGLGVRRTDLSRALHTRLDELGVPVIGDRAEAIEWSADRVRVNGVAARWLVGADGLHSPIRRMAGLDVPVSRVQRGWRTSARAEPRFGLRRHFAVPACGDTSAAAETSDPTDAREPTDLVEVHWAERSEAYVTPVPGGVGVAILTSERGPFDRQLARFPGLLRRLDGAEAASRVLGAGPFPRRVRRRVAGRVLLVGDAAGYVDALTGEGLSVAFAEARELVRCLVEDDNYEQAWRRVTRTYRALTCGLLWARRRRVLGARIVPAAARLPGAFTRAVHTLAD